MGDATVDLHNTDRLEGGAVDSKVPWWMDAVKTLGLPTLFLGVVTYMVWSAGIWAGKEVVIPIFNKQVAFIDEATKMTNEMTATTVQINKTLEAHGQHAIEALRITAEIHDEVKESGAETKMNGERLKGLQESMLKTLEDIERNTKPLPEMALQPKLKSHEEGLQED